MDRHFLEFWGNFLINAAKGQKQIEELTQWINQGLRGFEDLTAMFRKFYGLDTLTEESPDYPKAWQNATESFQRSFKDYMSMMGVVSNDEYLTLVTKYEGLKKKVAEQEENIKHLRMLLDEKGANQGATVRGFQELIKKQADQFQEFMKSFGQPFEKDSPSDDGE
jgi:hypothetical protein